MGYLARFRESVRKHSNRVAIVDLDGREITYEDFDLLCGRVAGKIQALGIPHQSCILVSIGRRTEYIAAYFGIMMAGCVVVPASLEYPESRLELMRSDCGSPLTITLDFFEDIEQYAPIGCARDGATDSPYIDPCDDENALLIYTSGSTGNPKGILHSHRSYECVTGRSLFAFDLDVVRLAAIAPLTFIAFVFDYTIPLAVGGTVFIVDEETRRDPRALARFYVQHQITMTFLSPQLLRVFDGNVPSLRRVMSASERLSNFYTDKFEVFNVYGLSELCGGGFCFLVDKAYENTPIGKPLEGLEALLLDDEGRPVPQGDEGELCMIGYFAREYLNLPEQTEKAFVHLDDGRTMFHTGDICKQLPSGDYVYINRKDWMVKVNGQRVETGEIETTLLSLECVRQTAVKAFVDDNGQTYLVAYVSGSEDVVERGKEAIAAHLPSYMMPRYFVQMPLLPLNVNGKINRTALLEPSASKFRAEYVAPETEVEKLICEAFDQVLHCGQVGLDDDFFFLGGDSIKTILLATALEPIASGLAPRDIFANPTPRDLAELAARSQADEDGWQRDLARTDYPLSTAERAMFIEQMMNPESIEYNINATIRVRGVDVAALSDALTRVMMVHEAFRSYYVMRGAEPTRILTDGVVPIKTVTLGSAEEAEQAIREANTPFDLGQIPVRVTIYEVPGDELLVGLCLHHIMCDGDGAAIIIRNLADALAGRELVAPTYDLSYVCEHPSPHAEEHLAFYQEMFKDGMPSNEMPVKEVRPDVHPVSDTLLSFAIDSHQADQLRRCAEKNAVTLFELFYAAASMTVGQYCAAEDVVLGIAKDSRDGRTASTVGMFINMLPVRTQPARAKTVAAYLTEVSSQLKGASAHPDVSFESLVNALCIEKDTARHPIYDVGINLLQTSFTHKEGPVELEFSYDQQMLANDIQIYVEQHEADMQLVMQYSSELFDAVVMENFAEQLLYTLGRITSSDSSALTVGEALEIPAGQMAFLDKVNENERDYERTDVVTLFRRQVERAPEATCVVYKDKTFTYAQVDEVSERIAGYLCAKGIGAEDVVSVLIPRGEYMVIASMGVLKSGAAYQPLDPSYPTERLEFMIADSAAKYVIADRDLMSGIPGYSGPVLYLDEIPDLPQCEPIEGSPSQKDLFIMLYTSGTTGTPKGVMIEHGNLVAFCAWYVRYYGLEEASRVAAYASYGFDACMMDMYPALSVGASVCIIGEDIRLDLMQLERYFSDAGITHSFMTTQVGRQFAQYCNPSALRYLSVGGEKLVPLFPNKDFGFCNLYGPTECTILTTAFSVDRDYRRVPIGRALDNLKLYIVDASGERVPLGVAGELWVAGHQVSRGYLNRPEKNAEAYIENPFSDDPDYGRIYKTGDIVRFLPDGTVDFVGRNDGQVKVRGFRIELPEVEEVIRQFPGIKDATVQAFDEPSGGKYIAAYIVSDEEIDINAMNAFIAAEKPPYMVPRVTMQIEKIPLNQNQKVDKRALPVPEYKADEVTPPQTEIQQRIFALLVELLGHDAFGVDTDFDYIGMTSIGAVQFNVMLSKEFNLPFKISDLQDNGTIRKMEALILRMQDEEADDFEVKDAYPLTKTQMGVFAESMAHPGSTIYNIPVAYSIDPAVDLEKLQGAVVDAINAHPYALSRLAMDASSEIVIRRDSDVRFDASMIEVIEGEIEDIRADLIQPFDLMNDMLLRVKVIEGSTNYLLIDMHHILSDGTSLAILLEDISAAYAGNALVQEMFSGYEVSLLERRNLAGPAYENAKQFYAEMLADADTDCMPPRIVHQDEEETGFASFAVEGSAADLKAYCTDAGVSMSALFNAAFGLALGKFAYKDDVLYTTIYNGRSDSRMARIVSMLVKTFPVRCKIDGSQSVRDYVRGVGDQMMGAMANDIYSFAEIAHDHDVSADILFTYQGDLFVMDSLCGEPSEALPFGLDDAKAAMDIDVTLCGDEIHFDCYYRADLFDQAYIQNLARATTNVAFEFTRKATLADVSVSTDKMRQEVLAFNDTAYLVPDESVNCMFERHAAAKPDHVAVIAAGESLSYSELNGLANKLAHALIERGVGKDEVVGLISPRTKEAFIGEIGILKSGAAFLPMVPEYPDGRIDYCLSDAECRYLVTTEAIKAERADLFEGKPFEVLTFEQLLHCDNDTNPDVPIDSDALAYCIYTSGSTGTPKGVMIEHRNLRNFLDPNERNPETANYVKHGHVVLSVISISFDFSLMETQLPLCNGLTVVMASEDDIHNPIALAELMVKYGVDAMSCTPSFIGNMIDFPQLEPALAGMRLYDFGAESFPSKLYEKLQVASPNALICNGYGPTEATISCISKVLDSGQAITIGRPAANVQAYVCDKDLNLLPVGACGELVVGGAGVGRGYVKLPEKTAAVFVEVEGKPAYRTGDLVRFLGNGEIEFFGRFDNQVKLRGFRVELDEIESNINTFPGVNTCKVVARNNGSEDYLAGFFTAEREVSVEELTAHLKEKLAYYMIPSVLMQLDAMPLTVNGKIDKKKLPDVEFSMTREYVEPEEGLETEICKVFAEVLKVERVGATDDFFEIGGTSLTVTVVVLKLNDAGYNVVYKDVFDYSTPRELTGFIRGSVKKLGFDDDYDYTKIEMLLRKNVLDRVDDFTVKPLGNIILTGASGFLGAHVLMQFLETQSGIAYCVVRKGKYPTPEQRLKNMMMFYHGGAGLEYFEDRIVCLDGDVTDAVQVMALGALDASVVINCAALVKHFVSDDSLDRINVGGVNNLIDMCLASGKRLIQVSTTSVGGMVTRDVRGVEMREDKLYFGQIIENDYIRTKFLAERAILEARAERGLDGLIIRVGNLMSRNSDGEFQINFVTNSFMRSLRAFKQLGAFPMTSMHDLAEFSPIDSTASAILTLATVRGGFSVFHADNSHLIYMSDVIDSMRRYGFDIEVVPVHRFAEIMKAASANPAMSDTVMSLIAYDTNEEEPLFYPVSSNRFTVEVLYRAGYLWPITDNAYLNNAIRVLDEFGFFEQDDEG